MTFQTLSFYSVAEAYDLIYPRPSDENLSLALHTPCLMMAEVSLETSPKNIMIQDMINSENNMNTTVSTDTNIFKTNLSMFKCAITLIHVVHL